MTTIGIPATSESRQIKVLPLDKRICKGNLGHNPQFIHPRKLHKLKGTRSYAKAPSANSPNRATTASQSRADHGHTNLAPGVMDGLCEW